MRMRHSIAALVALVAQASACGPSLPRQMVEAHAAASRAYGAGRYDEAAEQYGDAAKAAQRVRDRDEMLYLQASCYQRAGQEKRARAAFEALLTLSPKGERSARAAFEIVRIEIEHGDESKGYEQLERFVFDYPDSGLTQPALTRLTAWKDKEQGPSSTLAFLRENEAKLRRIGLGEEAVYGQAQRLEKLGELQQARDTYVRCSKDYPYPSGGLFDDSLYRASELDERLGEPRLAVEHLRRMLRERESASLNGSYERPRYSAAQLRIARLYRDALGDPSQARREYRRLYTDHKTSILRDDALWEEAALAQKMGDRQGACSGAKLLIREFSDSRYAPCASFICEEIPPSNGKRGCRDYLIRPTQQASQADPAQP